MVNRVVACRLELDSDGPNVSAANAQQRTVAYIRFLLQKLSAPEGDVLSLFSGTGTDAIAALSLGRSVACIDKDPKQVRALILPFNPFSPDIALWTCPKRCSSCHVN